MVNLQICDPKNDTIQVYQTLKDETNFELFAASFT